MCYTFGYWWSRTEESFDRIHRRVAFGLFSKAEMPKEVVVFFRIQDLRRRPEPQCTYTWKTVCNTHAAMRFPYMIIIIYILLCIRWAPSSPSLFVCTTVCFAIFAKSSSRHRPPTPPNPSPIATDYCVPRVISESGVSGAGKIAQGHELPAVSGNKI